jgi:hypothetical protein
LATEFVRELFCAKNRDPHKDVYTHLTAAIDPMNMAVVLDAVSDQANTAEGLHVPSMCAILTLFSPLVLCSVRVCQVKDIVIRR